jgi:hypothetical protein
MKTDDIESVVDELCRVGAHAVRRYVEITDHIRCGRCARAAGGHAAAVPPSSVTNSRRFMGLTPQLQGSRI